MGRKNKQYSKTLYQQAYDRLTGMQAFGDSKKAAIAAGTDKDKIFSFSTYQTYWKHTKYYIKWLQENHPDCTTLKKARRYANEWLQTRVDQGLSAWTIQTEAKALGKLFGIQPDDRDYFEPPKRHRAEITRSRLDDRVRDLHFSKTNNEELIKFCQGTGLRRSELEMLRGSDLVSRTQIEQEISRLEGLGRLTDEQHKHLGVLRDTRMFAGAEYFVHVRNGKGGRERISPIVGANTQQIVARMQAAGAEKAWQHVHTMADIHSYRGDYATAIYKAHARPIEDIPFDRTNKGTGKKFQSEVYTCRKDEAGKKLDKAAMLLTSKALGHNRIEVVANNYIRGL